MGVTQQLTTWSAFTRHLKLRFGPSTYVNHEVALNKLKQTTSVEAYVSEFEMLSTRTLGLTNSNLLNCFPSGLREDIQREMMLLNPQHLSQAMGQARIL